MGKNRKRSRKTEHKPASQTSITTGRFKSSYPIAQDSHTTHPVISLYYRQVLSLRQYLLNQLPTTSKLRRRRITSLRSSSDRRVLKESSPTVQSERQKEYRASTQSQSRSVLVSTDTGPTSPQSEVVDFVIGQLFKRHKKPEHVLTHGFQRPFMGNNAIKSNIPGVVVQFPNENVSTLKESPWTEVLSLLGQNGDEIMLRLLFDCGIFAPINAHKGSYYQLSGLPISTLEIVHESGARPKEPATAVEASQKSKRDNRSSEARRPNSIIFLRRSMLYSRHASWSNGKLLVGLGKNHVLNRFEDLNSAAQTIHVTMYMFPRQFSLRNVFIPPEDANEQFTSTGNARREDEIFADDKDRKTPKRLRGLATDLTQRLRVRHSRCSYHELLKHYCPTESNGPWKLETVVSPTGSQDKNHIDSSSGNMITQLQMKSPESKPIDPKVNKLGAESRVQEPKVTLTDHATPASSVSAFCRAVLLKLIPPKFFGEGPDGVLNRSIIMKHVDSFIKLRRFESLSLHEVCKGLKVASISWLASPNLCDSTGKTKAKMALSDFKKRTEILHEFVYYIFDSILIPLVRANFYVTESQTHRNRLFYFRHDVWQRLTKQPLADLKKKMFEEIETSRAQTLLARRSLGFGSLRLLPKSTGIRPILNLRRRTLKEFRGGKKGTYLAASINSSLNPIKDMLSYERKRAPEKFGSSLQFVGDIHLRLRDFKKKLMARISGPKPSRLPQLFFVKLDIQGCFDTIPQKPLLELIEELVSEATYHVAKHVEMTPSAFDARGKPMRKYVGRAAPILKQQAISKIKSEEAQGGKAKTVYIDTINQKLQSADDLLDLLHEHVRNNLVKMGKTYLRQRSGIPQGSVLSNLLCNFFYAQLEEEKLGFLRPDDSVLLRLVDDFLLVTTDVNQAMEFLQVMIPGLPSYGVSVNSTKSLANFTAAVNGTHIPRLEGSSLFPYCGMLIDTHTLEINRDHNRLLEGGDSAAATISDTLTVETSHNAGRVFRRKVLGPFRLQIHPMYLDDAHNSRAVVLVNLHTSFITAAMKMYRYMRSLRGRNHPTTSIITQTIHDLIRQTFTVIHVRRCSTSAPVSCFVQLRHIQFVAAAAFRFVLNRKQTRYAAVLKWLDTLGRESRPTSNAEALRFQQVVKTGNAFFTEWRF
ncbi:Telomere reverse transcriptase [Penicillium malachiteum]|uniref:Telomere reverse transcriptase n=1 Tax=Penicillium malachiteum TaxID=1324776 RepID=UPI00254735B8|nr:Telomere reverse transcriptase [Penicillium malachiteum]KAJ5729255.1 Telomere reverse transcriptase [Penicillium malachiteum]